MYKLKVLKFIASALVITLCIGCGNSAPLEYSENTGWLLAVPGDCNKYYQSVDGKRYEMPCPDGLIFYVESQRCESAADVPQSFPCGKLVEEELKKAPTAYPTDDGIGYITFFALDNCDSAGNQKEVVLESNEDAHTFTSDEALGTDVLVRSISMSRNMGGFVFSHTGNYPPRCETLTLNDVPNTCHDVSAMAGYNQYVFSWNQDYDYLSAPNGACPIPGAGP